jgi:hypothetical protein
MQRHFARGVATLNLFPLKAVVRDGWTRPRAGCIARRKFCPSTSTQPARVQIAEASDRQQNRSTAVCRALSLLLYRQIPNCRSALFNIYLSVCVLRLLNVRVIVRREPERKTRNYQPQSRNS